MRVLISGQAGIAAIVREESANLHSVDEFDRPVKVHPDSLRQVFMDATDVTELDVDDLSHAERELKLRWRQDRALHLVLMALDRDDEDGRRPLLQKLETLLSTDAAVADFIEARLHRRPLPDCDAATRLIDVASLTRCTGIATLLTRVVEAQPAIAKFDSAWASLPLHKFGTAARKSHMRRKLDETGLWRRLVCLRWTYEWQSIVAAIEAEPMLRRDSARFASVLPDLLYSCRKIHVAWQTPGPAPFFVTTSTFTKSKPFIDPRELKLQLSHSCLFDAERSLVDYAHDYDATLLDAQLQDAQTILLVTHHWQEREEERLRQSWAATKPTALHSWLENLATVSDECPLHLSTPKTRSDDFYYVIGRSGSGKSSFMADYLMRPLSGGKALRIESKACPSLGHAWHAAKDLKVTTCRDIAGLKWMENVISDLPGTDGHAASGFLRHPEMIEELLVDSPKTQWEWAASHALRVLALRSDEIDLIERLHAPCSLSTHAVAIAQLWRAEWKRGVKSLELMNDPVADVLRIHAFGALRSVKEARAAYDRARDANAPALSFARETLYNRFIRGEANIPDRWLFEREVDMLAEAA